MQAGFILKDHTFVWGHCCGDLKHNNGHGAHTMVPLGEADPHVGSENILGPHLSRGDQPSIPSPVAQQSAKEVGQVWAFNAKLCNTTVVLSASAALGLPLKAVFTLPELSSAPAISCQGACWAHGLSGKTIPEALQSLALPMFCSHSSSPPVLCPPRGMPSRNTAWLTPYRCCSHA